MNATAEQLENLLAVREIAATVAQAKPVTTGGLRRAIDAAALCSPKGNESDQDYVGRVVAPYLPDNGVIARRDVVVEMMRAVVELERRVEIDALDADSLERLVARFRNSACRMAEGIYWECYDEQAGAEDDGDAPWMFELQRWAERRAFDDIGEDD